MWQHFTSHHLRWKINSETSCACPCRNCTGKSRNRNHWCPSLSCTNNVLCISVVHASQVFTIFSFHSHVMAEPVPKGRFFIFMYLPFKSSSSKLFFFCLYTVLCLFYILLQKPRSFLSFWTRCNVLRHILKKKKQDYSTLTLFIYYKSCWALYFNRLYSIS